MTKILLILLSQISNPPQYELPVFERLVPIKQTTHPYQVMNDIESHLEYSDSFSDKVCWIHENTHLLDSEIKNRYGYGQCYYVLENKFVTLPKCALSLRAAKQKIPGFVFRDTHYLNFYFDNPTWDNAEYLLEEWNAYINGSYGYNQIRPEDGESEIMFALMFNVYCMYVSFYETDEDIINFIKFQTLRTRSAYLRSNSKMADEFWTKVCVSDEYKSLRTLIKERWGSSWNMIFDQ